ncbi:hypothetical protein K439DRAFT_1637505 [Ramaria rubella]|nr:hypothetical protein K439DRAFT_1637505 [Ramaria rubella]
MRFLHVGLVVLAATQVALSAPILRCGDSNDVLNDLLQKRADNNVESLLFTHGKTGDTTPKPKSPDTPKPKRKPKRVDTPIPKSPDTSTSEGPDTLTPEGTETELPIKTDEKHSDEFGGRHVHMQLEVHQPVPIKAYLYPEGLLNSQNGSPNSDLEDSQTPKPDSEGSRTPKPHIRV